jgi:hypothetical protein
VNVAAVVVSHGHPAELEAVAQELEEWWAFASDTEEAWMRRLMLMRAFVVARLPGQSGAGGSALAASLRPLHTAGEFGWLWRDWPELGAFAARNQLT